jgi:hypothetical protein
MAHCESESRRCWIRNTDSYRPFLDQLTGGIADLAGQYGDKTNKYVVTREAIKKYGNKDSGEDIIRRDILHLETRMKQPRTVTGDGMW